MRSGPAAVKHFKILGKSQYTLNKITSEIVGSRQGRYQTAVQITEKIAAKKTPAQTDHLKLNA